MKYAPPATIILTQITQDQAIVFNSSTLLLYLSLVMLAVVITYLCVHSHSATRSHSCAVEGVTSPVESVSS